MKTKVTIPTYSHWPQVIEIDTGSAPAGSGVGAVINWQAGVPWTEIAALIPDPFNSDTQDQGATIYLQDDVTYDLTAGEYNLANVEIIGAPSGLSVLNADAGFSLNNAGEGSLRLRDLTFTTNGTILNTALSNGIKFLATNCDLVFVDSTFLVANGSGAQFTFINCIVSKSGGGGAYAVRTGVGCTIAVIAYGSTLDTNIFFEGGGGTLNITTDESSIFRRNYQSGFATVTSSIQDCNEISYTLSGSVTIPGGLNASGVAGSPQQVLLIIDNGGDDPGNITDITVTAGVDRQKMLLLLKQNAAGTGTWPTTIGNVLIAGGSFTKTPGASSVDAFVLEYQDMVGGGAWIATSIALDVK